MVNVKVIYIDMVHIKVTDLTMAHVKGLYSLALAKLSLAQLSPSMFASLSDEIQVIMLLSV